MNTMDVNSPTVVLAVTSTTGRVSLSNDSGDVILTNIGDYAVFVVEGGSTVTAVFPTSSTPIAGTIIPANSMVSIKKNKYRDSYFAAITSTSGQTANLYIKAGSGY